MMYLVALRGGDEVHQELLALEPPDRPPDHSMPIELWSPIAGDDQRVVEQVGQVHYWLIDAASARILTQRQDDFPEPTVQWMVVVRDVRRRAVSRLDSRYQATRRAILGDVRDEPDGRRCRAGHAFSATQGVCWCGEPVVLRVV